MSQFDFPRINFHGQVILDTPTANNGVLTPSLLMFDQAESQAYIPPRLLTAGIDETLLLPFKDQIKADANGASYITIDVINDSNFQDWAITPLGSFGIDSNYYPLYNSLNLTGQTPGYWSYFGDISMSLQNVLVTGITAPDWNGNIQTYTPQSSSGCPPMLADMLGAELSFNNNYFEQDSKTTAYMCDIDSMGQMGTQIFYGKAGLYKKDASENKTFFSGKPCKSTARWMNLTRVLNWSQMVPMGGSAAFYSMIYLGDTNGIQCDALSQFTGQSVNALFMRFVIHEVYEVRNPDYKLMEGETFRNLKGDSVSIPKNPARAFITGSITPWNVNDMKTTSLCRIMKSNLDQQIPINPSGIPAPLPKNEKEPLKIPAAVDPGPVLFRYDSSKSIVSLDILNTINEYGYNEGLLPVYAGTGDVKPYLNFENYNFGDFDLWFMPDGGSAFNLGKISYNMNYNMSSFLANGGMVDLKVQAYDYTKGYFFLALGNVMALKEDDIYTTSDQQSIYAEQNQPSQYPYMSDGLPRVAFTLRVLRRGVPVSSSTPVTITLQKINMGTGEIVNTPVSVYDGCPLYFNIDNDGCLTYGFVYDPKECLTFPPTLPKLTKYAMRATMTVVRVMSSEPQLAPYLSGQLPITWQVVYQNVFQLYKVMYPIMDKILPFEEKIWSDAFMLNKMLVLIDEKNWNQPLYMPVTRDLSGAQRKLLQMWAQQVLNAQPQIRNSKEQLS